MLPPVTVRILAFAVCGWLLAGPAGALTLGRAHGATLIGRPLEVTIPVTLDGPANEAPCASADLYYGDTRVATPTVRFEPHGPAEGVVRVLSRASVDEPMVTVYLKVGCTQPSTRRYVLLAELPPEDEPAARATRTLPAPPTRAAAPAAPATPAPATSPRRRDVARVAPLVTAPAVERAARPAAKAAPAPRARKPAAAPAQARLKLEPLDLSVDVDPTLRLSGELGAPAPVDAQRRQAFAALWGALQRSPEQAVDDVVRLQGLERELGAVRDVARQNAATLAQLRGEIDKAHAGRATATALVAALAVVLAVLLAAIGWRWYRQRQLERVGLWFEANGDSAQVQLPTTPEAPQAAQAAPVVTPNAAAVAAAAPALAQRPARVPAAAPTPARAPASTWGNTEDFGASRGGTLRTVGVEELIDVHDKADFFLSIGETEQALAVLEAHVHDQVDTGALAWMDLLELYHSLGRRTDFERLRTEFRQRFLAQVPDFEHFDQPSASLENYSRALSRIVALWPSPKVLEVIEESIFRKPAGAGAEPFTLEAYRELVLLYHVARDMAAETQPEAHARATNFSDTSLQPLNMPLDFALERAEEPPLTPEERLMVPPPSARLGVDIDLGDQDSGSASELKPLDFDISTFDSAHSPDPDGKA